MKPIDLLSSYEWFGEFWEPRYPQNKFFGVLSYSPETGLLLKCYFGNTDKILNQPEVMLGVCSDIGPITLIESLSVGQTFEACISSVRLLFNIGFVGGHFDLGKKFLSFNFVVNDLNEFVTPLISAERHLLNQTLASIKIADAFYLNLNSDCRYSFYLNKDKIGSEWFISDKKELMDDLDCALKKICEKYPDSELHKKISVRYYFSILAKEGGKIFNDFKEIANKVTQLFSYFMNQRVEIIGLWVRDSDQNFPVIRSLRVDSQGIEAIRKKKPYMTIPITFGKIRENMQEVFDGWFNFISAEFNLLNQVIMRNIWSPYSMDAVQNYVLILAAIEYAHVQFGKPVRRKYDWFVERYFNEEMLTILKETLGSFDGGKTYGERLGKIRDYIVHYSAKSDGKNGIPASHKNYFINPTHLFNLCQLLIPVLIIHVYEIIGVSGVVIEDVKKNIQKHIKCWSRLK